MQNTTEKKKRGARIAGYVCMAFLALFIVCMIAAVVAEGELAAFAVIGVYVAIFGAMIVGIALALRQRVREIESGEEEDAKKY